VELLRKEFGVTISLGASNISFGLPERPTINAAFLALGHHLGGTCYITDPARLGQTVQAADLMLGRGDISMCNLKYFRVAEAFRVKEAVQAG